MGKDKIVKMILVAMALCGVVMVAQGIQQCLEEREAVQRELQEVARVRTELRDQSRHPIRQFVVRDGHGEDDVADRAGWSESNIKPEMLRAEFWRLNRNSAKVHDPLREGDIVVFPVYKK